MPEQFLFNSDSGWEDVLYKEKTFEDRIELGLRHMYRPGVKIEAAPNVLYTFYNYSLIDKKVGSLINLKPKHAIMMLSTTVDDVPIAEDGVEFASIVLSYDYEDWNTMSKDKDKTNLFKQWSNPYLVDFLSTQSFHSYPNTC